MLRFNHCRGPGNADRFAVKTGRGGGANPTHFINHSQTVAAVIPGHVQWTAGVVIPSNGNLAQTQFGQIRQINQFNIETETIDLRSFDQRPANIQAKSLEPIKRRSSARDPKVRSHSLLRIGSTSFGVSVIGVERSASEKSAMFACASSRPNRTA